MEKLAAPRPISRGSPKDNIISRTCNYAGVFHMEVGGRYALTLAQARQMCESLGTAGQSLDLGLNPTSCSSTLEQDTCPEPMQ
uniref:Link domain-containing protein n=1 Tax=Scleropages formosus TaxID=113540 RepID=A0A8C9W3V1_SCLFO